MLHDSSSTLCIFQVDVKKAEDAKVYLTLPATWDEVEEKEKQTGKQFHHSGVIPVTKDSFQLATLTCSTKLTQNGTAGHFSVFPSPPICSHCDK